MRGRFARLRPSPALGGAGYLPRESVTSKHLARGSVKSAEIARNAVKSSELAKGSVSSADVRDGSIKAADLAASATPLNGYAAYLQPDGTTSTIKVGWATRSVTPSTLTYEAPGRYRVIFDRAEVGGCAVPVATAFDSTAAVTMRVIGLGCSAEEASFQLATSSNADVPFLLQVDFTN